MDQPETNNQDTQDDLPQLFDLLEHYITHLKLSAGASKSAANTAHSYGAALRVFRRFIRRSYSRKRGFKAPYPVTILDSDVLLAYHDWLNRTPPQRKAERPPSPPPNDIEAESDQITIPATTPPPTPPRYAHSTIQFYLAAAKRFLTWAVAQGYTQDFDLGETQVKLKGGRGTAGKAYPHRKIDPNLAKILLYYDNQPLPDEAAAAQDSNLVTWQIRRRRIALLRNRAIVYVLFETGLRVSELTALKRDEIDRALKMTPMPEDLALDVVGKGGRQRTVWITQDSLKRIRDYLATRMDPSDVLFVGGKKGKAITRQMVWKVVKEGAKAAGVGDFTGPHAFRHWLARQLFNDEDDPVPMEDVQALLGHASPTTTRMIYAPHSSNSRLHRAIKKARKRPEETIDRDT